MKSGARSPGARGWNRLSVRITAIRDEAEGIRSFRLGPARAVVLAAQLLDLARELGPPTVDPRLDGALWQAQRVGDCLVRQLLEIAHQHRCPERCGQRGQRLPQQRDAVALFERLDRVLIVRDHRQVGRIHIATDRLAFFAHAPVVIDA